MIIVGQVSTKEEADEIVRIAKFFVVGQRARYLASEIPDKVAEEVLKDNYFKRYFKDNK